MMIKNKAIKRLIDLVRRGLPDVEITVDQPARASAPWFVDIAAYGRSLVVEYRPKLGFGLSSPAGDSYGEGADEFLEGEGAVAARIIALLRAGETTVPQRVRLLQELREQRHVSQVALATKLGVRQPTVSKIERRSDVGVSTVRRYVQALGGTLRITAEFADGSFDLGLEDEVPQGSS